MIIAIDGPAGAGKSTVARIAAENKAYKELGYNFKLILEHKEVDINTL